MPRLITDRFRFFLIRFGEGDRRFFDSISFFSFRSVVNWTGFSHSFFDKNFYSHSNKDSFPFREGYFSIRRSVSLGSSIRLFSSLT